MPDPSSTSNSDEPPLDALVSVEEIPPPASQGLVLSPGEWRFVAVLVLALFVLLPLFWRWWRPVEFGESDRIPYALHDDAWQFGRVVEDIASRPGIVVFGDSVIWGEFVRPDETLPARLRETLQQDVWNLGVNGAHPLALEGLLREEAGPIRDRSVILHLNLLWLSSPESDLSTREPVSVQHADWVPQMDPGLSAYEASLHDRIARALDARVATWSLAAHVRAACFDGQDLPRWSIEHPKDSLLDALTAPPPEMSTAARRVGHRRSPERSVEYAWVPLERSVQWAAFGRIVELLRNRRCDVSVLIGPFNQHVLTDESRRVFEKLRDDAQRQLTALGLRTFAPPVLDAALYGDASHPLAAGYRELASWLGAHPGSREWLGGQP